MYCLLVYWCTGEAAVRLQSPLPGVLVCLCGVLLLCTGEVYWCTVYWCTGTGALVRAAVRLQSPLSGSKSARLPSHCLISPTTVPYQNRENLNVKKKNRNRADGPYFWTQYEALILNFFLDIGKITRNASL